ncbi:MAG: S-layer homology domain-containing protein [Clostridiales bacterium]|jgi:hypothetical protein|nr:S-layer homology domain-containing protein [Clostridiales bacterium]
MLNKLAKTLRFLIFPLLIFVFSGTPVTAFAAASDISEHWAERTLLKWIDQGWLSGTGDGNFRPDKAVTRAEFVALINRMKGFNGSADISQYTDVTADKWYYNPIRAAVAAGYLKGTGERSISPDAYITRQEAVSMISRVEAVPKADAGVLAYAKDGASISSWAQDNVAACVNAGFVTGSEGSIKPLSNITKAEAVVLLNNVSTKTRSYDLAGTFGPISGMLNSSDVNVLSPGITLRNIEVDNNLLVDKNVGGGDVHLINIDVKGTLTLEGGGINSVYFSNSTINNIDILKDTVRVIFSLGSKVGKAVSRGLGAVLEFHSGTSVNQLTLFGSDNRISLASDIVVGTINVEGSNTKIETDAGTVIEKLIINAPAKVVGEGTVTSATVTSEGVEFEKEPEDIDVSDGLEVKTGSENSTSSNESSNDGSSSPLPPSSGGSSKQTATPTPTPTPTPTDELTPTPTPAGELTPTPTPAGEPTPTPTDEPTPTPTPTDEPTPTPAPTPVDVNSVADLTHEVDSIISGGTAEALALTDAFFDDANGIGQPIAIGTGENSNAFKIISNSDKALNVGLKIGIDNVRLEGLKIVIDDSSKAVPTAWSTSSYHNALVVSSASGQGLTAVEIEDCDITITGTTGFTSGIWIGGDKNNPPRDVSLVGNKVEATGFTQNAVQAVLIHTFDNSLTIRNNTLTAKYGGTRPATPYKAPASALFFNHVYEAASSSSLQISGNALSLNQFSFYINALPSDGSGTLYGVPSMISKNFSTPSSTWAADPPTSIIKSLFDAVISGNTSEKAFAAVMEKIGDNLFEVEHYEIANDKVTGVSYYGELIVDNEYKGTTVQGHFVPGSTATEGSQYFNYYHPDAPSVTRGKSTFRRDRLKRL